MESAQPIAGAGNGCNALLRGPSPHVSTDLEQSRAQTTSLSGRFVNFWPFCRLVAAWVSE